MTASSFLISDFKYVQGNYRKEYLKTYTSAFISRIKEVKEYEACDNEYLDIEEVQKAIGLLLKQDNEITGTEGFESILFPDIQNHIIIHHIYNRRTSTPCRYTIPRRSEGKIQWKKISLSCERTTER